MKKCRHEIRSDRCEKCFEERFGTPDKTGKRKGFAVLGYKTGGKW